MKEQIKNLAVKVIGMTDEEAQSLIKKTDDGEELAENFVEILAQKDRERIGRLQSSFKDQLTEMHDKGYKKAQKEALSKFEKEVKEKYGYETDKFGIELVDDIVSMNKGKGQVEDIKTHPEYIKLERKLQSDFIPKTEYEEITNQFESFKTNVEKQKVTSRVKEDARKLFRSLNPILSKDPKKAANQENEFLSKLDNFDYQVNDDGNHVIIKEGKRLENENLNPVAFSEFVKTKASELYDFAEQDTKGNSGVTTGTQSGGSIAFKDKGDFLEKLNKEHSPDIRVKMYETAKKQGIL